MIEIKDSIVKTVTECNNQNKLLIVYSFISNLLGDIDDTSKTSDKE